jgi:hypothetical protein
VVEELTMTVWQRKSFFRAPVLLLLVLVFLFGIALGLRLYNIAEPPSDFHPTRQYRSAIIARGYYYEALRTAPEWKRDLAGLNKQREDSLEPPIMELMASFAYRIYGGEHLWIPRLLSITFWMVGGVFLYLIARQIVSAPAAVISTAFYLLLPYGVIASRSFQPDPLMVMLLLVSIFTILRYHDKPSGLRLGIAASISSLAALTKPVCLFLIFGTFFSIAIYRQGIRRSLTTPTSLLFTTVTLSLSMIYYGYGILGAGSLRGQAEGSFSPHLLVQSAFWENWLKRVIEVIGGLYLIVAVVGVLMLREGLPRALIVGLWSGYFVFGLAFNYYILTHDYYQLQFIPVVALSLGPVGALILRPISRRGRELNRSAYVRGILLLAGTLSLLLVALSMIFAAREARDAVEQPRLYYGGPLPGELAGSRPENRIETYKEIGEAVEHSPSTLFWAPDYGKPLQYHGWLSGTPWPRTAEIQDEKLQGVREISTEERFEDMDAEIAPEYFIVILDSEWSKENKDLEGFLTSNFSVLVENDDYLVFSL